jgi:hypothetical protein
MKRFLATATRSGIYGTVSAKQAAAGIMKRFLAAATRSGMNKTERFLRNKPPQAS